MGKKLKELSAEFQSEIQYRETISIGIGTDGTDYTFTGTGEKPSFRIGLGFSEAEEE